MLYEQFKPTGDRDFTLIVVDGLAYRDTLPPDTQRAEAINLLQDAKRLVETKTVKRGYVREDLYQGSKMLDAFRQASHRYDTRTYWSALDALQLAMEGFITLEPDHSRHRKIEQEGGIVAFTDQVDTTTEMIIAIFGEAIDLLTRTDTAFSSSR